MHRSAEGKSANRTLDVETGLANIQAVNFELDVVGPNHEATGFKRRAHIFSHHIGAAGSQATRAFCTTAATALGGGHLALR
jgi:hypothetical protein